MSIVDTLTQIINIPSVTLDEAEICQHLQDRFSPRFAVERVKNSLIVGERTEGRPFYVLYGHTDTVPEQGDPKARIENGNLHGLGASDMKGGVAVMIDILEDASLEPIGDVVCVFYAAEEGAHALNELEDVLDAAPWLTEAEMSIVLEPTDLNVEMGCNGVLNADVRFIGKSSHSARPWLGENAVTKGGAWLAKLDAMEPSLVDIGGLEYREVFSVTRAEGGIANNIIPPTFTINLNHRFPPIYSVEQAEARLREVAAEADEVVIKDRAPAGRAAPEHPEVQRLEAIANRGRKAKQGWTDVARLTARGAVAVNYGPGIVAQAHQVDEYIPIAYLEVAFDVVRRFLEGERRPDPDGA